MVYGKINIFKTLILCLIVLFCSVITFGNKNKIETNLLKVIFPTDIIERKKYEKYLRQRADLLEYLCEQRGIKLWERSNE